MTKEQREKIEERLQRIRYRMYQAGIQLASHDFERLISTAKGIRLNAKKLIDLLPEIKVKKKRKSVKISFKQGKKKSKV